MPLGYPNIGVTTPTITFTDGTGAVTITCLVPHLNNWLAGAESVGEEAVQLGTGRSYRWPYRTDYTLSFDMPYIPSYYIAYLLRLKLWLENGGTCVVNTQDNAARSYTCAMVPKKPPTWKPEQQYRELTLHCELLNLGNAPAICIYESQFGTGNA